MPKNLALIEDDPIIMESLTEYLPATTDTQISLTCDSVEKFLKKLNHQNQPEILLLDIGLPGMSGIEGIPHILNQLPELDIIILTTYEETDVIFDALCAGACSYLSKKSSLVKIAEAVTIVKNGGSYMSPSIAKKIATHLKASTKKSPYKLSPRQKEIIKLIADGLSYKQIAETCFISMNTVRSHIKNIYVELKINSKVELIKKLYDGEI